MSHAFSPVRPHCSSQLFQWSRVPDPSAQHRSVHTTEKEIQRQLCDDALCRQYIENPVRLIKIAATCCLFHGSFTFWPISNPVFEDPKLIHAAGKASTCIRRKQSMSGDAERFRPAEYNRREASKRPMCGV